MTNEEEFTRRLLAWHAERARSFPWRNLPDPFAVLLAEVMLQRTQASQAARIFEDFIALYPTAEEVVDAGEGEIEQRLAGLGLRHRARRVFLLCRALVDLHGGRVPEDAVALAKLPGVGPYTVGAVRCFAFDQDDAIVDRNIVRVLTRVFGFSPQSTRAHTDPGLWLLASSLVPPSRAKAYNYALLDFAASVCKDRPDHDNCPLADICRHFQSRRRHRNKALEDSQAERQK